MAVLRLLLQQFEQRLSYGGFAESMNEIVLLLQQSFNFFVTVLGLSRRHEFRNTGCHFNMM